MIRIFAGALLGSCCAYSAACSNGQEGGRFIAQQPAKTQANNGGQTAVSPAPDGSSAAGNASGPVASSSASPSSPLEDVMRGAKGTDAESAVDLVAGKRYLQMSEEEKYEFVEQRARHVSRMIGSGTYEFSRQSIGIIKQYVDAYARRVGNGSRVTWGEDLNLVFGRGRQYAPVIIRSFNAHRISPAIGLYLVAIETEYTNFAHENEAGAAGLFQFVPATAQAYGVAPNDRTNVEKMSPAAAHYIADRIAEFGTDPMSVALCIAGYNRNPDSVRNDLQSVMNSANKERSFWTLVTNSNKLDKWFQGENIKYVPKYFAAAIVGETPWVFGLNMKQALSTCTGPVGAQDSPRVAAKR